MTTGQYELLNKQCFELAGLAPMDRIGGVATSSVQLSDEQIHDGSIHEAGHIVLLYLSGNGADHAVSNAKEAYVLPRHPIQSEYWEIAVDMAGGVAQGTWVGNAPICGRDREQLLDRVKASWRKRRRGDLAWWPPDGFNNENDVDCHILGMAAEMENEVQGMIWEQQPFFDRIVSELDARGILEGDEIDQLWEQLKR